MKIGFIGLGNMATAIIGGLLGGMAAKEDLVGADKSEVMAAKAAEQFGIKTGIDNTVVTKEADYLFLAVKPQFVEGVLKEIAPVISEKTVVISIVAGKSLQWICDALGKEVKLVRTMPNTPALVGEGCTAMSPNALVTAQEKAYVKNLLASFGTVQEVPENLMDAVVGISGSSPAYVFLFIEAMADAAVVAGMPRKQAYEMAAQAVLGSAKMVLETGKHPGELKDMVCSPGGTTIDAVKVLEEMGFRAAVMDAVEAAVEKSKNL